MGRVDRIILVIKMIIALIIALIIMLWIFNGHNITPKLLISKIGMITFCSIIFILIWNYWLWKLPLINQFIAKMPNLNGVWKGEIINAKENKIQYACIKIKQTYFDIKINVEVDRANSYTIVGDLLKIGDEWKLIWTWEGIDKDNNFFGTTILNVNDFVLEGFYFTNYNNTYKVNENITYDCNCTAGYFKVKKIETC